MVKNPSAVDGNLPLPILSNYNYPANPSNIPPEMIVITSQIGGLTWYVNWKTNLKGMPTKLYTLENDVYPYFTGVDNAEKLRNFIISKYNNGACFVLLVGNMDYVPIRYVLSPQGDYGTNFISDLYYAGLDGNWNADGDGVFGERTDYPDFAADIFVGRVAATPTPVEIETWTDKLVTYVDNPGLGNDSYLANVMISSSDQMAEPDNSPRDFDEPTFIASAFSGFFNVNTESFREQPSGGSENPTWPHGNDIQAYLGNTSVGYYFALSHGSPDWYSTLSTGYNNSPWSGFTTTEEWQNEPVEWGWVGNAINGGRQYVQSATSCDIGALDCSIWYAPVRCFAEQALLLYGGCVAGTFNTRYGLTPTSSYLEEMRSSLICSEYYHHSMGISHYAMLPYNTNYHWDLIYSNNFFGDPSMRVWTDDPGLFSVEHPSIVHRDYVQNITITVKNNATQVGISNVLVSLAKGNEVYGRGFTDVTGRVIIPIKPDTEGMLKIVADRANFKSYVDSITVDTYCEPAVAGDANGNGVCNGLDVTFLQNYFRGSGSHPPDSCMCGDVFVYHAADANGSCTLNGLDVTYLVTYFNGGPVPHFCSTCAISRFLEKDNSPEGEFIKQQNYGQ
jgi:hypothetical protein